MREMLQVRHMASARLPLVEEEFQLHLYTSSLDDKQHLALVLDRVEAASEVLVRVHSECFTGDVLGSIRCDCGEQLHRAIEKIAKAGRGVLVYLRQEGRGIGLLEKLRAYNLQDEGYDTVEANLILGRQPDERDYGIAATILMHLGVRSVRLLTNNPSKVEGLRERGIAVTCRVPLEGTINSENVGYLQTKRFRLNHHLELGHASEVAISPHLSHSKNDRSA